MGHSVRLAEPVSLAGVDMPVQILIAVMRISHNIHSPIPLQVAKARVGTTGGHDEHQGSDDSFWTQVFGDESQGCLSAIRLMLGCHRRLKATLQKQIHVH